MLYHSNEFMQKMCKIKGPKWGGRGPILDYCWPVSWHPLVHTYGRPTHTKHHKYSFQDKYVAAYQRFRSESEKMSSLVLKNENSGLSLKGRQKLTKHCRTLKIFLKLPYGRNLIYRHWLGKIIYFWDVVISCKFVFIWDCEMLIQCISMW